MGAFAVGTVVTVPFPYTDQSATSRRPAVVVAQLPGADSIVCAVTRSYQGLAQRIEITDNDFVDDNTLRVSPSFAVPCKILTTDDAITKRVGTLTDAKRKEIVAAVRQIFC